MATQFGDKKFTAEGNAKLENEIKKVLETITEYVSKDVNPSAIFVYGSYGRGEGTAFFNNYKFYSPSDFEIGYVSKNWLKRRRLFKLNKS